MMLKITSYRLITVKLTINGGGVLRKHFLIITSFLNLKIKNALIISAFFTVLVCYL